MNLRKLTKKLGISVASLGVALVVGELVARALEPGPFSLLDSQPYEPVADLRHVHKQNFEGRWDGTWYATNSLRMRGPEFEPAFTAEELRVLCVGDSCTFGKGVLESESWPRQLETLLGETLPEGRRPMVGNLGVNGYSGKQYEITLDNHVDELQPQLVVIGYNLNDFPNVVSKVDRQVFQGKKNLRSFIPTDLRDRLGRFALFRWLRGTYYEMNRAKDWKAAERMAAEIKGQSGDNQRYEQEAQRIASMAARARAAGAEVILFLFPYESQVYLDVYDSSPIDWLRSECEKNDIPFFNAAEAFREYAHRSDPPSRMFLRGDRYHPTADGYRIIAECLIELIREQQVLPMAN